MAVSWLSQSSPGDDCVTGAGNDSNAFISRYAAGWFWDHDVFDFVAAHLHVANHHSMRTYVLVWELKKAGMNWRQAVLNRCLTGVAFAVTKLKTDQTFHSEEDRPRAFVAACLDCRATYFNYAKKLQMNPDQPKIKLKHASPPDEVKANADYLDILLRRFGPLGNGKIFRLRIDRAILRLSALLRRRPTAQT